MASTSEPQILAPSSVPRSVALTSEPWISAPSSEPWILVPSMDSALSSTSSFMFQRDDATRHTGSDHDRCCGGRAPVCRGSKARPELLPLLAGRGRRNGLSAARLHFLQGCNCSCCCFLHCLPHCVARSTTLQQLLQHAASSAAVPMCFYFRKCLTARSEAVKQCG